MNLNQILSNLFVGSCPESTQDIARLKADCSVTAVLNLQTDEDFDYWNIAWKRLEAYCRDCQVELRRVPVRDFDHEDLRKNLATSVRILDRLLSDGHTVYVHCSVGASRSPSVVIAYLHWVMQWDLDKALDHVSRRRPCQPNLEAIRQAGEDRPGGRGGGEQ